MDGWFFFFFRFRLSIIPKYNSCNSRRSTGGPKKTALVFILKGIAAELMPDQTSVSNVSFKLTVHRAVCCRSMCVTLVFSTKGQRYLRVGLAVPLSGSVSCLRAMVAEEGRISPDQVHTISPGVGISSRNRFYIEQRPTVAVRWESLLVTLLPSINVFVMGKR